MARTVPTTGTDRQRIATLAAGLFLATEIDTTSDQKRMFIGGSTLVGPVRHADVSSQSAMLALNTSDSRGCFPCDIVYRTDRSTLWICITNRGASISDWFEFSSTVPDGDKGDIVITSGVWEIDSSVISAAMRAITSAASISAARTALGLAIGSNVQAYNSILAALAGLSNSAGVLRNNGTGTLSWDAAGGGGGSGGVGDTIYLYSNFH